LTVGLVLSSFFFPPLPHLIYGPTSSRQFTPSFPFPFFLDVLSGPILNAPGVSCSKIDGSDHRQVFSYALYSSSLLFFLFFREDQRSFLSSLLRTFLFSESWVRFLQRVDGSLTLHLGSSPIPPHIRAEVLYLRLSLSPVEFFLSMYLQAPEPPLGPPYLLISSPCVVLIDFPPPFLRFPSSFEKTDGSESDLFHLFTSGPSGVVVTKQSSPPSSSPHS